MGLISVRERETWAILAAKIFANKQKDSWAEIQVYFLGPDIQCAVVFSMSSGQDLQ